MSLAAGTRLGPYEILGLIGAGGMGEVYRGRDTRLDRSVAIKVLPTELSGDPDRRARFEREAQTISALNHPHICTLFDVGEAQGQAYLVMEHLTGETLAERLKKGPSPLEQALIVGGEIADALAAAHRQGIIHRDLKPGNVMLTKAGAKLLDFGLAKLKAHGERRALVTEASAATEAESLTGRGTILGTLPYMAPEQLEGKPADARTDLWALGAILYEMVTGQRAFAGTSSVSLIGQIMNAEPPALATRQPLTPPTLERLVTRCLAKDPDQRWDSAHDVADELRWISQSGLAPAVAAPSRRRTRWRAVALAAVLVILAAAAGGAVLWRLRPRASHAPVVRSLVDDGPADELNAGGVESPWLPTPGGSRTALTWTPDGHALVFVGRRAGVQQLYVRELERGAASVVAGTDGAQVPVVSADGMWVAFWSDGAIRKVALGGGPSVIVCRGPRLPPAGMSWSTTGRLVYANLDDGALWQVPAEGGPPTALTKRLPHESRHVLPHMLPGDAAVMYTVRKHLWIWGQEETVAQTLMTGERTVLLRDAVDARYVPSGHLVFLRQGTLLAVPFDPTRLEVRGGPVPLVEGMAQALTASSRANVTGAGQFSVAQGGTLAYVGGPRVPYPDTAVVAVDRLGAMRSLPLPVRPYGSGVRASPDGQRLAVTVITPSDQSIWLYDFERGALSKLTPGAEAYYLQWTSDSQRVAFSWNPHGARQLFWQRADGSSSPPELLADGPFELAGTPSGNGREFVAVKDFDIGIVSVGAPGPVWRPLVRTPAVEQAPAVSPDGAVLAYESDASGRFEVYVQFSSGAGTTVQVSIDGGRSPAWNPKRGELFFVSPGTLAPAESGRLMVVDVRTRPALSVGRPRPLFELPPGELALACWPVRCYDVAPDGQRFYAVQRRWPAPLPPVTHINMIQNWVEELKAKVPVAR